MMKPEKTASSEQCSPQTAFLVDRAVRLLTMLRPQDFSSDGSGILELGIFAGDEKELLPDLALVGKPAIISKFKGYPDASLLEISRTSKGTNTYMGAVGHAALIYGWFERVVDPENPLAYSTETVYVLNSEGVPQRGVNKRNAVKIETQEEYDEALAAGKSLHVVNGAYYLREYEIVGLRNATENEGLALLDDLSKANSIFKAQSH